MCSLLQLYNSILNNHTLYPALDMKLGIKKTFQYHSNKSQETKGARILFPSYIKNRLVENFPYIEKP